MPACAVPWSPILGGAPSHVTKITNAGPARGEHHQYPFIERIDQYTVSTFFLFDDGLPHPRSRPFLFSLMDDGSKWRIDEIRLTPFTRQPIKPRWQRMRTWIEVKFKFRIQFGVKVRWCEPIMLSICSAPDRKFVFKWIALVLMYVRNHRKLHRFHGALLRFVFNLRKRCRSKIRLSIWRQRLPYTLINTNDFPRMTSGHAPCKICSLIKALAFDGVATRWHPANKVCAFFPLIFMDRAFVL